MKTMSLDRRIRALERTMPRPVVVPEAETRDLDQYQALMDASAMRANGRLAPSACFGGMVAWQCEFLDNYGEAIAALGHLERKGDVDQA